MKKQNLLLIILFLVFYSNSAFSENVRKRIPIETKNILFLLEVDSNNKIYQTYLGPKVNPDEIPNFNQNIQDIYPNFGTSFINEPAIMVTHADGNTSTEILYIKHSIEKNSDGSTTICLATKDSYYPFYVNIYFKTFYNYDIIEEWAEIYHKEKNAITISKYASSYLSFQSNSYFLTQFYGNWANEMNLQESKLTRGIKILDSKLGVRSDQFAHPCFLVSFNGKADENSGNIIGGTLAWPGSWSIKFEVDQNNYLHILSGINDFASEYKLKPSVSFLTPSFLFTFSTEGTGEITRNFHRWARVYGIHDGGKLRPTLLNNWEATYFDFNESLLTNIIKDAGEMGFELFLLDDGWFGEKYPRNNDSAGLGDWIVNTKKLPNGLGYLVKECEKQGIKFGIWIEPEMVNPKSELFEKHPDWVIGQPHRPLHLSRNQLILDLCNPKVQNYVFETIDNLLNENPGISYIKWDCNRYVTNPGSYFLSPELQSHLWIEYTRGLFNVLNRIRARHNDVSIMVCSGGGGRIDYGTLPYFDEFWISDNTDAVDRIFIQWGATYFFPAMAMASHVSVVPNHITGRTVPLKFRFDVAMAAKLGMDLQPSMMSEKEREFSKNALKEYYKIRNVVQFGDLYRLLSPYSNQRAAFMYVSQDMKQSVVFTYLLKKAIYGNYQPLILKGLDPNKIYKITEINKDPDHYSWFSELDGKKFSGDFLMKYGIRFPMYNEYESKIILLTTE